jgi:hypothetical protein
VEQLTVRRVEPNRAVVHLLPTDLAQGPQTFAHTLRDRLDGPATPHRTATLFQSPGGTLEPDYALDVVPGRMRRLGFDPRVVPPLRRLRRALVPGVVVAHGAEPLMYASFARPAGSRLVAYEIEGRHESRQDGVPSSWHRRLLRRADRVVAVSDHVAAEAVELSGCDPGRVVVIPDGRDPERFGLDAAVGAWSDVLTGLAQG